MEQFASRFSEIKDLVELINSLSLQVTSNTITFFEQNTLPEPNWREEQASFTSLISWTYVLYFECSPSIRHLEPEYSTFLNYSRAENMKRHCNNTVHDLRTFFQHNLPASRENQRKIDYCYDWLEKASATKFSRPDLAFCDWFKCISQILGEIDSFLKGIEDLLTNLKEEDEMIKSQVTTNWIRRIARSFKPFEFETVLKQILLNYGIEQIDTTKVAKMQHDNWSKQFQTKADGFDFHAEATKIVEAFVLKEIGNFKLPFPLNGKFVIEYFALKPGKNLGKIMTYAKSSFDDDPKSKEQLLSVIKQYLDENPELRE